MTSNQQQLVVIPALQVLAVPPGQPASGGALSASSASATDPITVAVPDLKTAEEIYVATSSKFEIRMSDPDTSASG
jgi:hypothetical protein